MRLNSSRVFGIALAAAALDALEPDLGRGLDAERWKSDDFRKTGHLVLVAERVDDVVQSGLEALEDALGEVSGAVARPELAARGDEASRVSSRPRRRTSSRMTSDSEKKPKPLLFRYSAAMPLPRRCVP
jgi:hypothetical protein